LPADSIAAASARPAGGFKKSFTDLLCARKGVALAVTILISAVVSLTLVPMLCAKLLKPATEVRESTFQCLSREAFDRLINGYAVMLRWVLDRQNATLLVAAGTLALTVWLYIIIPKGFFPVQDTGLIQGISEAPQSISFAAISERQQALAAVILKDPDVESLSSFIGVDGTNITLNSGRFLINLKPHDMRTADVSKVIRRITRATQELSGISLYLQPVQDLTIDTAVSRAQYQFSLEDANPQELAEWAPKLVDKLNSMPQFSQVSSDISAYGLTSFIDIDRDTAGRFGITPATIDNALYDSFSQRIVSTIFTNSNQYRVILETDPKLQASSESLSSIYVPTSTSSGSVPGQVPLTAVATVREGTAPLRVDHLGQFPSTAISFNLGQGYSLGDAVDAIQQARQEIGLPISANIRLQGAALAFQKSLANELLLILAAIVTVYIVLGVLYESLVHPVTILSTLPSAGIGALLAPRLRARCSAQRGEVAARSDLSGLPAALPADPDDHYGGGARRAAADDRNRRRVGAAPSARRLDRWRTAAEPGADAVHHAGDLPVVRSPAKALL
jgi:multidrug efflux pump